VTTRGGRSSGGAAPAQAGVARASRGEEGGVGDGLLVVGQAELLENQHVVDSGEHGKNNEVGDVIGSVGEARVEAMQEGEDELRVLHEVDDVTEGDSLDV
jgi:hypothetical protein